MENNYVVIMAGGIGSRFWPLSRQQHPKQFIDILGTGKTLIQMTYERFKKIIPKENIYFVIHESHAGLFRSQLPEVNDAQILQEPIMRNTAPCIAYACHKIQHLNANACIVVAPSDHLIIQEDQFKTAIESSLKIAAKQDVLITLGVLPSRPDTGYGYIQYIEKSLEEKFKKVKTFTEKPNLELATSFLQSGDFLWNSGIFIWSAKAIICALAKFEPEINELFSEGSELYNTGEEPLFIAQAYMRCTGISIDFAVMEKASNVYVLPVDFGWSDLGTWGSVYELSEKNNAGNVSLPDTDVVFNDTQNCMVNVPKDKLVVLQGLQDYVVVESNQVLLVFPRKEEQNIKQILSDVKSKYGKKYI